MVRSAPERQALLKLPANARASYHASDARFVNALRAVLRLAPLVSEAARVGRIYHDGWPAQNDGNRRKKRTTSDAGESWRR